MKQIKLTAEKINEIKILIKKQLDSSRSATASRRKEIAINQKLYRAQKVYNNKDFDGVFSDAQLGQMNGYIKPYMAQMKTSLRPRYRKITKAQATTAKQLNLFIDYIAQAGSWDLLAQYADKDSAICGRAIFRVILQEKDRRVISKKSRRTVPEKMPKLELINPAFFFIDPTVSPLNFDDASYTGHQGVKYTLWEISQMFTRENKKRSIKNRFIEEEIKILSESKRGDSMSQEEQEESGVKKTNSQSSTRDFFNCHVWHFDFEGTRYYAEYNENRNVLLKLLPLVDVQGHNMYPYASYAYDGDPTMFWSIGLADLVRDAVLLQNLSTNQMIDIAQRTIDPQWFVFGRNGGGGEIEKLLRYIPSEFILFDEDTRIEARPMPNINTPMSVYENVSNTAHMNVGLPDSLNGLSSQSAVNINNSDLNRVGDLMRLPFQERTEAYRRIGILIKKLLERVDKIYIPAQEAGDFIELSADKIKFDLDVFVETANVTDGESETKLRLRMEYVSSLRGSQVVNQKFLETILAQLAGLDDDQIREMFSVTDVADQKSAEYASEDFVLITSGDKPRKRARYNFDYMQVFIDLALECGEYEKGSFEKVLQHIAYISPKVSQNADLEQAMLMQQQSLVQNQGGGAPKQQQRPLRLGDGVDTVPQDQQIQNF